MTRRLVLASLAILAACSSSADAVPVSTPSGLKTAGQRMKLSASWAQYARSFSDLKNIADFGARVTVVKTSDPIQADDQPVFRWITVSIDRVLWRAKDVKEVPKEVTFKQTGGVIGETEVVIEDDPLFAVGDTEVLFLKQWAPGMYRLNGGPSVRFGVKGETISVIAADGVTDARGMRMDEFATALR